MILKYRVIHIAVLITVIAGSAFGQATAAKAAAAKAPCLNRIGQREWAILLKDLDPAKKKMLEDKDFRKDQVDGLQQLLAFGCEARKRGLDADKVNASELEFVRSETLAVAYDAKRSKLKPGGPVFSWVTDAQIDAFYKLKPNVTAFERFLNTKTELLRRSGAVPPDREPTAEEAAGAKEYFARMKTAERSAALMTPVERAAAEFKARVQQTQFLSKLLSQNLADEVVVSDAEVAKYIAEHPEFDDKAAREKATKIRDRAKKGEDFAALANEFSEDPGNDGENGKKNGGLYADVPKGMMVPPFEAAALALEPGQVSDLVKSDFGFHVIKLERKSADGQRYDVRHILIATGVKDPNDPTGKTIPAPVYVRAKLEAEREADVIVRIVSKNPVVVEDIKLTADAPATGTTPKTTRPATTRPATRKQ